MSYKVDVSIIIPAQNEENNIVRTVDAIVDSITIPNYEVLVCNDHSTDSTLAVAENLAGKYPEVWVISNTGEKGFGNVLRFGFEKARGKFVVPMMADLCDDPKTVNDMYSLAQKGFDVIVGSRYIHGGGKKKVQNYFKSFCSRSVGWIGHHIQGIPTHDTTNAFKMMRKSAILTVKPKSNNFDISLELTVKLHKSGFKVTEVPTVWTDRTEGESKFRIFKTAKRYFAWVLFRR